MDDDIRIEKNSNGIETYVFDPYNPLNTPITKNDISEILKKYGIDTTIHNYELYKRAFIHRSYLRRPDLENEQNVYNILDRLNIQYVSVGHRKELKKFHNVALTILPGSKYRVEKI